VRQTTILREHTKPDSWTEAQQKKYRNSTFYGMEHVNAVKRVTDIMSEISPASNQQSQSVEQINQAITQMDEVTRQNAALVEEAAAEPLEEEAHRLTRSVGV